MHIAFMTSLVPDERPQGGFAIANRAVVDGLRALGHRVSVVGAALPDAAAPADADTHVLARLELENAQASRAQQLRWLGAAMRHGLPFAAGKLVPLVERAAEQLDRLAPDLVVLNSYQFAMPPLRRRPFIYLAHNVEHETSRENAQRGPRGQRLLYARDARLLARLERDLVRGAAHVWTLAEPDREAFGLPVDASGALPLVVPRASHEPTGAKAFDTTMIGTWTWTPNTAGLAWYLNEVVPLLPRDMRVAVAGRVPDALAERHRNVNFLGRVDDAAAFLDQGHVVPLVARGGTGVQLKTIEAFQAGRATVATASSLRGVAEPPANCCVADEPATFAAALADLVARGRAGEDLSVDGRAFFARQRDALLAALDRGLRSAQRAGDAA